MFVSENFQHKKVSKYALSVHTSNIRMLEYSKLKLFAVHKSFIFQMLLLNLNLNVSQTALSFCSIQIFANYSCICLQIAQFIFNRKLMSAFPYWIDSSMTKIIDILYSIISHYIWTIQFALNYLSFMPAIYSYLHRKTINRTKKENWFVCGLPIGDGQSAPTADWSIIQFARIQLLCPKAINRTRWRKLSCGVAEKKSHPIKNGYLWICCVFSWHHSSLNFRAYYWWILRLHLHGDGWWSTIL